MVDRPKARILEDAPADRHQNQSGLFGAESAGGGGQQFGAGKQDSARLGRAKGVGERKEKGKGNNGKRDGRRREKGKW